MSNRINSLAKEYAIETWGKDYSYTMLPGDPAFARELRNIKELEDLIRWLIPRLVSVYIPSGSNGIPLIKDIE